MVKKIIIIAALSISTLIETAHPPAPLTTRKRKLEDAQDADNAKRRKIDSKEDLSSFINDQIIESVFDPEIDPYPKIADVLETASFSNILSAYKILTDDQREAIKKILIAKYKKNLENIVQPGTDSIIAGAKLHSFFIPLEERFIPLEQPRFWEISNNNRYLRVGCQKPKLLDLSTGKLIKQFENNLIFGWNISSLTEKYFVERYIGHNLNIWDIKNDKLLNTIDTSDLFLTMGVSISSDNKYIAIIYDNDVNEEASTPKCVGLRDINSKRFISFRLYRDSLPEAYFSSNNKYMIVTMNYSRHYGVINKIFDIDRGQLLKEFNNENHIFCLGSSIISDNNLIVKIEGDFPNEPDQKAYDKIVKISIYNLETGQTNPLNGFDLETLKHTYFSPDNKYLATAHQGNVIIGPKNFIPNEEVLIWDTKNGKLIHKLIGPGPCAFSNDNKFIAILFDGAIIHIYNLQTGEQIKSLDGGDLAKINSGKYSDFHKDILSYNSRDERINSLPQALAFSIDNKLLKLRYIYTSRGYIYASTNFWDLENDTLLTNLCIDYSFNKSTFSKDGKYLINDTLGFGKDTDLIRDIVARISTGDCSNDYVKGEYLTFESDSIKGKVLWSDDILGNSYLRIDNLKSPWLIPELDLLTILFLLNLKKDSKYTLEHNDIKFFLEKIEKSNSNRYQYIKTYCVIEILNLYMVNDLTKIIRQYLTSNAYIH